jgi:hypothetical protein
MSPINRLYGADHNPNAVVITISALPPENVSAALREIGRFTQEAPLNIRIICRRGGARKPRKTFQSKPPLIQ